MKKIFFVLCIIVAAYGVNTPCFAEISVKDYMSYEFMDTQGYSGDMLRLGEINKAKTFGEKIPYHWSTNKVVRGWQKFWAYIDPADDYGDFGEHDIKVRSTLWDY